MKFRASFIIMMSVFGMLLGVPQVSAEKADSAVNSSKQSGWDLIGAGNNLASDLKGGKNRPKNSTLFEHELLDQNKKPSGKFEAISLADGSTQYKFRVNDEKGSINGYSGVDSGSVPIIYVNIKNTQGVHNGTSWETAYTNLQDALAKARATSGAKQIWIAKGTYLPGSTPTDTFNLPNNVKIYGGFSGNESSIGQRNLLKNKTILSGDILNNDLTDPLACGYDASHADNSRHVITAHGVTATLDGLYVVGGFAFSTLPLPHSPSDPDDAGGGLTATNGAKITLNLCVFSENSAYSNGGGVFLSDPGSTLLVTNSLFTGNNQLAPWVQISFPQGGGGIAVVNDSYAQVTTSIFQGNTSGIGHTDDECDWADLVSPAHVNAKGHDGGAIQLINSSGKISQTLFRANRALSGGAINVQSEGETSAHSLTIDASAFINHHVNHLGGAIEILGAFPTGSNPESLVTITNTIFDGNESHIGGCVFADSYNVVIDQSIFRNNTTGGFGGALSSSNVLGTIISQLFGTPATVGHVVVTNTEFSGNTSTGNQYTAAHFNTIFAAPPASRPDIRLTLGGAGIANFANGNLTADKCTFKKNQAVNSDGGAILNGGANIIIFGFGLDVTGGNLVVSNSEFNGNSAINCRRDKKGKCRRDKSCNSHKDKSCNCRVTQCMTSKCRQLCSTGNGGAIASVLKFPEFYPTPVPITQPTINVQSSQFGSNTASNGGAVYFDFTTPATILGNTFAGSNKAKFLGNQIYGTNSIVNGIATSSQAAVKLELESENTFLNLDCNKICDNLDCEDFYFQ